MKRTIAKASLQTALNLLFFTVIGTSLLAFAYSQTKDAIRHSEEQERLKLIAQIVPPAIADNDIVHDTIHIPPSALLGTDEASTGYRVTRHGHQTAVVLQAIAPDGYGGKISLIMAIQRNGNIAGVRVVSHNETPGLGDYIDIKKSPWIKGFDGKSEHGYNNADWKVKKDGGKFDYMAGATITPRAVVKAVHKALQYFAQHKDTLFAASSGRPHGREANK